jgi:transcriptional regulator with XRE-family HTH domain
MDRSTPFGRWLRAMRRDRGYETQEALREAIVARGAKVARGTRELTAPSVNQISRWESGTVHPSREYFQVLLEVFELDEAEVAEARRVFSLPADEPVPQDNTAIEGA